MIESVPPAPPVTARLSARAGGALVMCAAIPWHFHRNRQQELAQRLSAVLPVLYVEPPTRDGALPAGTARGLWTVGDQCHVLPSVRGLPGDRACGPINYLVQKRLAGVVKSALSSLRHGCALLWIDRIQSVAFTHEFPAAPMIYDCVDEEWSFGRLSGGRYLRRLEKALLARADLVIASSRALHRRLSVSARRAELVPNGCDFAHFVRSDLAARPSDLPPSDHPIIGFIGSIARRSLDLPLLSQVCRRLPHLRFLFVGSADTVSARALSQEPNAVLLGPRPYADLPAYLGACDVAIIPYLVGGRVDYVYPKKLHEYLAAGKPVVATDMPELRPFASTVSIARTPEEFVAKLQDCLEENADPALSARRIADRRAVAQQNTWETRVARILALLDSELTPRGVALAPRQRSDLHV